MSVQNRRDVLHLKKEVISTKRAPPPVGAYSQATRAGSFVFVSGQGPADPRTGRKVEDFKGQVHQTLGNIKAILEAAGSSMENVVKATVYINDTRNWGMLNEVWTHYFPKDPPARAVVEIAHLDIAAEIEVIAIVPEKG